MTGVNKPLYYRFLLRSYPFCVTRGSRKVPAREAASDAVTPGCRKNPARFPQETPQAQPE